MILKDKRIILTGAGRGIGRAIAEVCAKEGADLCLVSRTESELDETLNLIKQFSKNSFYTVLNISDEESVEKSVCSMIDKLGTIDVLINNAGIQMPIGQYFQNNIGDWKKNIEINLFGTANMIYFVLPEMIKNKKGKIINMSGGGSTSPRPNFSAYAVSKTAIVRFTENLALELKEFNIDVNAVSPGAINTKMLDEVIQARELSGNEYEDSINRKRKGGNDPGIAAELICFLSSDLSNDITGKLISAQWDDWRNLEFQEMLRINEDFGTLRRIDNKNFSKK